MPENCSSDCPMASRIEALEADSRHNKEAHKEFYSGAEASRTASALLEEKVKQIKADTEEIKENVQALKDKPGKRWESLVGYVLSAIAGAFILWLASGMPGVGK